MREVTVIDVGDHVECDWCGEDYTSRDDKGGLLFQSKAVCPKCAAKLEVDAAREDETHFIRAKCPPDKMFRVWCLELRGGDNRIIISSG